jgi:hypothetical protein
MKLALPFALLGLTVGLIVLALVGVVHSGGTVGIAAGAALPGLTARATTPEQAISNFLTDVQRRNWSRAYAQLSRTSSIDEASFIQDWTGSNGSLRTVSNLESFDVRPMHATDSAAQMRTQLRWSTPVGVLQDVRDFNLTQEAGSWKVVWRKLDVPAAPAQVIPVTYLRWDLVSGGSEDEWGSRNVDAPHVRIVSMNAIASAEGSLVMGELVNEDTIPAFVNVNAILLDGSGAAIDEESSFDKIAHVLLPKQVTPYRIDFPNIPLKDVKNVRMDVKATLVPTSADPVIGVINQKIEAEAQGRTVLHGELLSQSGQTVNIPHVIVGFYDNNGKVVWVADGYVDRPLLPQTPAPFAVEIPSALVGKIQNFHVVVNQYSVSQ